MAKNVVDDHTNGVCAQLNYHLDDGRALKIVIDADGISGKRIFPPLEERTIHLQDVRQTLHQPKFKEVGLEFVDFPSEIACFDDLEAVREGYECEAVSLIKHVTDAVEVKVFDHTIRVDGPCERQPARHVHSDYNAISALARLQVILGEVKAKEWQKTGFGIVNIWRPIVSKVQRAPLVFIDPLTLDETDWLDIDLVYPDRTGHIIGLKYNPAHRWYYWPEMTPHEVVVFNVYNSKGLAPVAHSAADLNQTSADAPERRSIETRCLVRLR